MFFFGGGEGGGILSNGDYFIEFGFIHTFLSLLNPSTPLGITMTNLVS